MKALSTDRMPMGSAYARPFTVDEAVAWSGVSRTYMYELLNEGALGVKVGRHWYIPQSQLAAFFLGRSAEDNRLDRE